MKKQYQNIFNANEIEKQKHRRSTRRIQQADGGLTCEEAPSLQVQPAELAESAEQLNIQPRKPPPTEPASNCGALGYTRIRSQPSVI
ncbi:uncharacterized protein PADG_11293 [Paracoccidioides brasiliensis Pb18]|uniref:Uncharacterized protein n=1 Tax=Paracoccidioides brasiliensis (strain Pb18) TaxID=502780 RepID=A0A0A0HV37_PARBD|nr:uncharacterized protein PADG_11293 [Paracoccidioides brasiliensis Pb18]KGM92472.1 hypothetical protein PADG_11293 [Paracoccidioides brasiliensis Pb18]ODH49333.1 hypothetical protein GX48_04544 [Paracoccidioides brasiliensis]